MLLNLSFILETTGAVCLYPESSPSVSASDVIFHSVCIDSRKVEQGSLFACLRGEHVDGHHFVEQAVQAGCAALLVERNPFVGPPPVPTVIVPDVALTLRNLAIVWRNLYAAQETSCVVALTGTAGKTTVKELLAHVLEQQGTVSKTHKNFNNGLGLPLSVLNAKQDARWWVMEVGISQSGDMDELGSVLRPDVALILNVGLGHAEGLGEKGTAYHKAALLKYLTPTGLALVSADYSDLVREARAIRADLHFFSATGRPMNYRASHIRSYGNEQGAYRVWFDGTALDIQAPFQGTCGAENIAAVAATAHLLGITPQRIATALADACLPAQRFSCLQEGEWLVIDDSYNANPLSMERMLDAALELAKERPLLCVLGEMKELGSFAEREHRRLGQQLGDSRIRALFWKGDHAEDVVEGLEMKGFSGAFQAFSSVEDFNSGLNTLNMHSGVVLFKGSRSNHLEELVAVFRERVRGSRAL